MVDGVTLGDYCRSAMSINESAQITLRLSKIVERCHERRVIHRDIKPDNILISRASGQIWLIDYGIGWAGFADDSFATEINQELGNRFLRLPELHGPLAGSKHDHLCDITFLCSAFFWLLTHSKPFQLVDEHSRAPHEAQKDRFPQGYGRTIDGILSGNGDIGRYIADLSRSGALTASLNWYRANLAPHMPEPRSGLNPYEQSPNLRPVEAPTLGIWSTNDHYLDGERMKMSGRFVSGPGATSRSMAPATGSRWMHATG
jgi:serine/threonine protein kinase